MDCKEELLFQINNENVTAASHEHVVELIRRSGDLVSMTVLSAPQGGVAEPNPRHYATLPRKLSSSATLGILFQSLLYGLINNEGLLISSRDSIMYSLDLHFVLKVILMDLVYEENHIFQSYFSGWKKLISLKTVQNSNSCKSGVIFLNYKK